MKFQTLIVGSFCTNAILTSYTFTHIPIIIVLASTHPELEHERENRATPLASI